MRVERFKASEMKEALEQVKEKLGPDAVILHTRTVPNSAMLGLGKKDNVEVIAAIDQPSRNGKIWTPENLMRETTPHVGRGQQAKSSLKSLAAKTLSTQKRNTKSAPTNKKKVPNQRSSGVAATKSNHSANTTDWDALLEYSVQNSVPRSNGNNNGANGNNRGELENPNFSKLLNVEVDSINADKRLWLESEKRLTGLKKEMNDLKEILLRQELQDLHQRVHESQKDRELEKEKQKLTESQDKQALLYKRMGERLYERGLAESISTQMVEKVQKRVETEKVDLRTKTGTDKIREILCEEIANLVPTLDTHSTKCTRPRVIAFVGPPGSGKSSACAKVAVKNAYLFGKKVSLILANMSANGVAQHLASVANITQMPLAVVQTPSEIQATISAHQDKDLILIDFSGSNSGETTKLSRLGRLVKAAAPHETHLVLPANLKTRDALATAKKFRGTHFDRLVFSKVDETATIGSLVEVIQQLDKPLSYFSIGPVIPDDIEPASAIKLAHMILAS